MKMFSDSLVTEQDHNKVDTEQYNETFIETLALFEEVL